MYEEDPPDPYFLGTAPYQKDIKTSNNDICTANG